MFFKCVIMHMRLLFTFLKINKQGYKLSYTVSSSHGRPDPYSLYRPKYAYVKIMGPNDPRC